MTMIAWRQKNIILAIENEKHKILYQHSFIQMPTSGWEGKPQRNCEKRRFDREFVKGSENTKLLSSSTMWKALSVSNKFLLRLSFKSLVNIFSFFAAFSILFLLPFERFRASSSPSWAELCSLSFCIPSNSAFSMAKPNYRILMYKFILSPFFPHIFTVLTEFYVNCRHFPWIFFLPAKLLRHNRAPTFQFLNNLLIISSSNLLLWENLVKYLMMKRTTWNCDFESARYLEIVIVIDRREWNYWLIKIEWI